MNNNYEQNNDFQHNQISSTNIQQAPITQSNNQNANKSGVIIILIIGLIAALITFLCLFVFKDNNKREKEPTTPTVEDEKKIDYASSWNGTYSYNDILITIYQSAPNIVSIEISSSSTDGNSVGGSYIGFEADVSSESKIVYDDDFLEEGANIIIEKTNNGIIVTSSSDEVDSLLNIINGTYNKKYFNEYGWSGTYKNEDISIILSEVGESNIKCSILKGYSEFSISFSEVSDSTLNYLDSWDNDSITIIKTNNGFELIATTEDSESLLNKINGLYIKQ